MSNDDITPKNSNLLQKIREYQDAPGVYLMKDKRGRIIYIGKAKSLKKRVQSYFSGEKDVKTRFLLERVADIETILTRSEDEALVTENNLIKKWQPKYNINLKDGKTYPVIRLTNERYPRIFRTRRLVLDGSRYFGPFPSAADIDIVLHVIEKIYPLRKCRGPVRVKQAPCMYYHIGRCPGICAGKMTDEEYRERVAKVVKLLEGETEDIIRELKNKMTAAAEDLQYERAALVRDQIEAVERLKQTQQLYASGQPTEDYIGLAVKDNFASFVILKMREGKILTKEVFHTHLYTAQSEALTQFLYQYYSQIERSPETVYIPLPIDPRNKKVLSRTLDISILFTEGAVEKTAAGMAQANAEQALRVSHLDGLVELKTVLALQDLPLRIEGFDIAHLEGTYTVASMVSFFQGRPDKSAYRRFKIKSLGGSVDDYEAMREVVARRYTRLRAEDETPPDLILIDGGKGQLESARGVLAGLELGSIPVIGLAKRQEEIFLPGRPAPLVLPHTSPALRILVAVRDESHRFATTFHKLLRDREAASSVLEKIKGIGKQKAKRLITHFSSLETLVKAEISEIAKIARVSEAVALDITKRVRELLGEG